jgi:SAM-dependent methyltransferase
MLNKLLFHHFPGFKSVLTRALYEYLSVRVKDKGAVFMNFGYAPHHEDPAALPLAPEDEPHRYPLQLYHHIAKSIQWENADALEVSSGRGGGAHFIMRHFRPRSYKGVDFSTRAIDFCRSHYTLKGLSFEHGNAEALPYPDNSFDVVVNVEASLYYPNITKFFEHVRRVLKPNGYFLYTDLRYEEKVEIWRAQLRNMGLKVIKEEEITNNVLKAMELDRERRIDMVRRYAPRIMHKMSYHLAGLVPHSPEDDKPHLDHRKYWHFILQKT